jgi:ABC-type multidrug transport system ATPase subunit
MTAIQSIEFIGVSAYYGYRGLVRIPGCTNVSLIAVPGKVVFLRGGNGSGKSTFIKALLDSAPEVEGTVRICMAGTGAVCPDPVSISVGRLTHRVVLSYLPQDPIEGLPDNMVLETALMLWEKVFQTGELSNWPRMNELYRALKSKSRASISGGQAQIIGLLFAVYRQADIYLLDEPTAFVSSPNRSIVKEAIASLLASGKFVFVATHDEELQDQFGDQEKIVVPFRQ